MQHYESRINWDKVAMQDNSNPERLKALSDFALIEWTKEKYKDDPYIQAREVERQSAKIRGGEMPRTIDNATVQVRARMAESLRMIRRHVRNIGGK